MTKSGAVTSPKPHQKNVVKPIIINLEPNHRGLAIVVLSNLLLSLKFILRRELRFTVCKPRDKPSLNSYMQAVDLVELKHHPIIVVVDVFNFLLTDIGHIDMKEDNYYGTTISSYCHTPC